MSENRDLTEARKIDADLWDRMESLLREIVDGDGAFFSAPYTEAAKAIVADLDLANEPEEARAERLLCEIWYAPKRFDAVVKFAVEQVERGRLLATTPARNTSQIGEG